jgi:hypothetical protein
VTARIKITNDITRQATLGDTARQIATSARTTSRSRRRRRDAVTKAAKKRSDALEKAAQLERDAINRSVKNLVGVMRDMRQRFGRQLETARAGIGELFQGPVLNPSAANTRQVLGLAAPSAAGFAADLRAQTAQFVRLQTDLAKLRRRGAPTQLISELRAQGVAGLPQIEALAGAPKGQLQQFFGAFQARERVATRVAAMAVQARTVRLVAKEPIVVDLTVNLDGKVVSRVVTQHQQRTAKKTAAQTRGSAGGVGR